MTLPSLSPALLRRSIEMAQHFLRRYEKEGQVPARKYRRVTTF
jgi:hypothetical protein